MDLDDILGGGGAPADPLGDVLDGLTAVQDLDDLLGGSPTGAKPQSPTAQDFPGEDVEGIDVPSPRLAPLRGPLPPRQHPVQLSPFRDAPAHVRPYMTNACYYANQVTIIDSADTRVRRGLVVNDSNIYVMTDKPQVERTIPLPHVEAFVLQDVLTVKALGISKEVQTHILLVLREGPDLFFALSEDRRKDPTTGVYAGEKIPPLDGVLVDLLQTYNLDLPVCYLKAGETIRKLVTWTVSDIEMRRECFKILAYRTNLVANLKDVIRYDARLILSRNQIEASGASQTTALLLKEMDLLAAKNESTSAALRHTEETLKRSRAKEGELRGVLQAEKQRREALVRERVAARQGERIAKEAREFALMRAAHNGEMHRLRTVAEFLRGHALRRRSAGAAAGAGDAAAVEELRRLRAAAGRRRTAATEALAEAKRRLAEAKATAAAAGDAAAAWRGLSADAPLPSGWDAALAPSFLPVHIPEETGEANGGGANATAKGSAVVLDDSDDGEDILIVPQQQQEQKGSKSAKPAIVFDDDDL